MDSIGSVNMGNTTLSTPVAPENQRTQQVRDQQQPQEALREASSDTDADREVERERSPSPRGNSLDTTA